MSTATLTKPESTTRMDGTPGFAVAMTKGKETSQREEVEIVPCFNEQGVLLGIDRVVELHIDAETERVAVFSNRGTEMITVWKRMCAGSTAWLYPVGHPDAE